MSTSDTPAGQDGAETSVCNQEWLDIDGESHCCVKDATHRDGQHEDGVGNRWGQRWMRTDQFGPCPAGQVEPDLKFPTLADAEELTMSHSAGRWVPQGIGDLIRAEYRRRGERIAALERELTAEAHPPNPTEEGASVAALRRLVELHTASQAEHGYMVAEYRYYNGTTEWDTSWEEAWTEARRALESLLADCPNCARFEAERDLERSRRTLGGVPPPVDTAWANRALPPPESASDDAMPAHRRVGMARSDDRTET